MNFVKKYQQICGADIQHKTGDIEPHNGEGRIGMSGIDKYLPIEVIIRIAHKTICDPNCGNPNVIIKAGKNAKWYLKHCDAAKLPQEITKWRASKAGQVALRKRNPPYIISIEWKTEMVLVGMRDFNKTEIEYLITD